MRIQVSVLGGLLAALIANAAESPAALPAAVAAGLDSVADTCREVDGKPHTDAAAKSADLNRDGHPDFVLYVGWASCDGAASIYGDREKGVTVYAGDGAGGAVPAFDAAVFDAKIEGSGAAAKLWLTVSGAQCGKPPARDFASENFCDRALDWNAKTKKFEYAPVSSIRSLQ